MNRNLVNNFDVLCIFYFCDIILNELFLNIDLNYML